MNVYFYIPVVSKIDESFYEIVEMAALKAETEVFHSVGDLSRRLRRPAGAPTIAALLTGNKEDLLNIVSIRKLLSGMPVILILPDREKDTVAMGHALSPRFLTYTDSNLQEVTAVLGKVLEKHKQMSW